MKKAISIALILMLVLSMALTACSSDSSDDSGDDGSDASGETWAIVYGSTLGDLSFNDSAQSGLTELSETVDGFDFDYFECANDATKYESSFMDYADSGDYSMIWSASTTLREYCESVASVYPDQKFGLYDCEANNPTDNTYTMTYKQNDGSYLVGIIAGYITETNIIGAVGGDNQDVINDFFVGYIQGAQTANSEVKIAISYNGSYTDIAKAKELTLAQFAQGSDVIFQVASAAGQGCIEAAAQEGKYAIGVDSDQAAMYEETDPDLASCIVTSMLKNVGDSLVYAYNKFVNDEIVWGTNDALGIAEGGVGYVDNTYYQTYVSEEVRALVEEAQQDVIDGLVTVDTAYGKDADWMEELRTAVSPV